MRAKFLAEHPSWTSEDPKKKGVDYSAARLKKLLKWRGKEWFVKNHIETARKWGLV